MDNLETQEKLMKRAGAASVCVAVILVVIKVIAWNQTSSVSIFASMIDSAMDALASLINFIAIKYSLEPPDHDHRYGHGKAEAVAGLGQASFIAGSAVILLLNVIDRVIHPRDITKIDLGVTVMMISLVLTILLVMYQRYVVRKTSSTAVKADALHYLTDILANGATLIALFLAAQGWPFIDLIVGFFIGLYILHSAWEIVRESLNMLLDRELPDDFKKEISDVIMSHDAVRGYHDMRTRQAGIVNYVQFHLELDDTLTIIEAHDISDEVEELMKKNFPNTETIIHIDPHSIYNKNRHEGFNERWQKAKSD